MRPNRTPSTLLAFVLAALAVALACLADPDPFGGGSPRPVPPKGGRWPQTRRTRTTTSRPPTRAAPAGRCPANWTSSWSWGRSRVPGSEKIWDPINEECRCLGGMTLDDDDDSCEFSGVTPGGGGPGSSNENGATGNLGDPGETDPDEKKLKITLRCRPGAPLPGVMIACEAKPRNAEGSVAYKWRFAPDPERVPIRDGMTGPVLPRVEVDGTRDSVWAVSSRRAAGCRYRRWTRPASRTRTSRSR